MKTKTFIISLLSPHALLPPARTIARMASRYPEENYQMIDANVLSYRYGLDGIQTKRQRKYGGGNEQFIKSLTAIYFMRIMTMMRLTINLRP